MVRMPVLRFICGALIGALLATAVSSRADTLVLKDGRRITGDVIEIGGRYMVKSSSGSVTFPADQVAKWEKSTPAPPAAGGVMSPRQPQNAASPAEIAARAAKLIEQG